MKKTIIMISLLLLMSIDMVSAVDNSAWTKQAIKLQGQDMFVYSSCGKTQYGDFTSAVLTTKDGQITDWELFSCTKCMPGNCYHKVDATVLGRPLLTAAQQKFMTKN